MARRQGRKFKFSSIVLYRRGIFEGIAGRILRKEVHPGQLLLQGERCIRQALRGCRRNLPALVGQSSPGGGSARGRIRNYTRSLRSQYMLIIQMDLDGAGNRLPRRLWGL